MYCCESWTIEKADCWTDAFSCVVGEDSWESLEQQRNQTSQSEGKSTPNIHWKDWCWSWSSDTLALDVKSCFSGKGYWESAWYWESVPFLALSTVTAGHWLSPWASLFHQRGTTLPTHSLSRGRRTKEAVIDRGIAEVKDGWTRHALKMLLTLKVYDSLIEKINSNK